MIRTFLPSGQDLSALSTAPVDAGSAARDHAGAGRPPAGTARAMPIAKPSAAPATFEAALAELEAIVASMEGGQLPLAESLAAYKRGAELVAYCQAALKDAQQQIEVLDRGMLAAFASDGDGNGS